MSKSTRGAGFTERHKNDNKSSRAFEARKAKMHVVDTKVVPVETVEPVDTRTPEANLAGRSNIVRSKASAR